MASLQKLKLWMSMKEELGSHNAELNPKLTWAANEVLACQGQQKYVPESPSKQTVKQKKITVEFKDLANIPW